MTADEYIAYCGTHSDHLTIPEPCKSSFFSGLKDVVAAAGNKVVFLVDRGRNLPK